MSPARENGHPTPFDLDAAASAAEAEAEGTPFNFTYAGAEYSVPPAQLWPVSALRLLGEGDLDGALGQLLGPDAYGGLCKAGLKLAHLNALFDAIAKGSGLGNLPNSRRTAGPVSTRPSRR